MLLERAVLALYWPHPLVWAAQRAAAMAREIAADDAVLRADVSPTGYAQQLLDLSHPACTGTTVGLALGLGSGKVAPRVHALFSGKSHHEAATQRFRRGMIAAALMFSLPLVTLQPMVTCTPARPVTVASHLG
jgi:beta-lactamase regulating signal transducer with metallopeptidase domain